MASRRRRFGGRGLAVSGLVAGGIAAVVATVPALVRAQSPTSPLLNLTATSLTATELIYTGTSTDDAVTVLDFTMSAGSFADVALTSRCDAGLAVRDAASTAAVTAMTLHALTLTTTVGGNAVTYDAANPPSATAPFSFPSPLPMTRLGISATQLAFSQLTSSGLVVDTVACTGTTSPLAAPTPRPTAATTSQSPTPSSTGPAPASNPPTSNPPPAPATADSPTLTPSTPEAPVLTTPTVEAPTVDTPTVAAPTVTPLPAAPAGDTSAPAPSPAAVPTPSPADPSTPTADPSPQPTPAATDSPTSATTP